MDNTCFVIMPSGDPNGYAPGHFNRVYDYVIVPACRAAGYWPTRADKVSDPLEVIKAVIDSDIVIGDLSAGNHDALYGLSIRKALNLPVTLLKDLKSFIAFGLQDFDVVEYDDSLRIDTVQKEVELLSEALKNTIKNKGEKHELLNRLGVGLPKYTSTLGVSIETIEQPVQQEEPAKPKEAPLPVISPLPEYVGDPLTEGNVEKLKPGDFVFHINHGKGEIKTARKIGKDKMAEIIFESGSKTLILSTSGVLRQVN